MGRNFAPEFRGNIDRRFALPSLRAGDIAVAFFSLAVIGFLTTAPTCASTKTGRLFSPVTSAGCAALFTLPDTDGHTHALSAQKGRPVIVHFFATWCEPCKAEFGTLQHFFEARGDKLAVMAVNVGEVPGRVRSFLKETPVGFPVLLDEDRSVTKAWAVNGLPATVVLDKSLRPILAVNGDLDWTSADVASEIEDALAADPNSKGGDCTKENNR
jgi:peroxiredoxin